MSAQELIDSIKEKIENGQINKDEPIYFGWPPQSVDWISRQNEKCILREEVCY